MLSGVRDYIRHERMISRNAQLFLLGAFFLGIGQATFMVMRNLYFEEAGFSRAQIGDFNSIQLAGTVVMAIPTALLITRLRAKFVLVASALLAFAGYVGQALGTGFGQVFVFSSLLGIGGGVIRLAMPPLFMRSSTPRERVYLFGMHRVVRMSIGVGAMLVAGVLVSELGVRYGSKLTGFRWVLVGGAAATLMAVVPFLMVRTRELAHTDALKRFSLFKIRSKKTILKICTPEFLIGAGSGLFLPFANLYFKDRLNAQETTIAAYIAGARVATIVGYIVAPVLARRLGMLRSVVTTELLSLPFFVIMAFLADPYIVVMAYLARQSLMNMTQPTSSNFAMEVVPPQEQAITNSLKLLVWNGGRALFAMLGGRVIQAYGFTPAILGTATMYLGAALCYIFFFRKHPLYERIQLAPEGGTQSAGIESAAGPDNGNS